MILLTTSGKNSHAVTAECPVTCLDGILPARALNQLRYEMPHGTVGDIARLFLEDQLLSIRGMGLGGIERIRGVLTDADLIDDKTPRAAHEDGHAR
jgi:hypothetical protein